MPTLIALLRGVNVGTANRLSMAALKKLLEKLGYTEVRSLLNSGNLVFSATESPRRAAARIEMALLTEMGMSIRVLVVSAEELAVIVKENSLLKVANNPSRMLAAFLEPADRPKIRALLSEKWGKETLALGSRAAYLWLPEGVARSKLVAAVERALLNGVTMRNWATVLKLHAMAGSDSATPSGSQTRED